MSAYSNFRAVNDQSAMGWASVAQGVAKGLTNLGSSIATTMENNRKQTLKQKEKFALTFGEMSLQKNQDLTKAREDIGKLGGDEGITNLYLNQQTDLMNGVGKEGDTDYQMGSIEAATRVATGDWSTQKELNKLQDTVNKADNNLISIMETAGVIVTEIDEISTKYPAGSVGGGNEKAWLGGSFGERSATSFTTFALNEREVPGVDTTYDLNKETGNLTFKHTIKKSDPKISGMDPSEFTDWEKANMKDNGDSWTITQVLTKDMLKKPLDLYRDVDKGVDYKEEGGPINVFKDGTLNGKFTYDVKTQISDKDNKDYEIPVNQLWIDTELIEAEYTGVLDGKIDGYIFSMSAQEKRDYFLTRRDITLASDFTAKTPEEQKAFIKEIETKALREQLYGNFENRKMTDEEAAILINQGSNKGKYVVGSDEYKAWKETPQYFAKPKYGNRINVGPGSAGYAERIDRKGYNMIFNQKSFNSGDTIYANSKLKSTMIAVYDEDAKLWQLKEKASVSSSQAGAKPGSSQSVSKQKYVNVGDPTTLAAIQRGGQLGYTKR
tara:strand:- start:10103 stop:11758 length:1656 start_codon:yes stop_codon:yes gene_type:complete